MRMAEKAILSIVVCIGFAAVAATSSCSQATRDPDKFSTFGDSAAMHDNDGLVDERIDAEDSDAMAPVLDELQGKGAVFVGETHDRYDHHLNQLETAVDRLVVQIGEYREPSKDPFPGVFQGNSRKTQLPPSCLSKRLRA